MNANAGDTPRDDLLALYAAGGLTPDEAAAADRAGHDVAAWELYADTVSCLVDAEPVAPPPELKSALLARLDLPTGYTVSHPDPTAFHPTPFPGITMRVLNIDRAGRRFSSLFKFAPGARLPAHPHATAEECVLLEGALYMGGVKMTAGTYLRVEAGVDHVEQWSDTGGLAFITGPLELLEHDDR